MRSTFLAAVIVSFASGVQASTWSSFSDSLATEDVSPKVSQVKHLIESSHVPEDFKISKKDVAAIFIAVGYEDLDLDDKYGESTIYAKLDDDLGLGRVGCFINIGAHDMTLRAYFGAKEVTAARKAVIADLWDSNKRLSHVYVDNDGDFVLESDTFLSTNTAANAYIVKHFAETFALSAMVFKREAARETFKDEF